MSAALFSPLLFQLFAHLRFLLTFSKAFLFLPYLFSLIEIQHTFALSLIICEIRKVTYPLFTATLLSLFRNFSLKLNIISSTLLSLFFNPKSLLDRNPHLLSRLLLLHHQHLLLRLYQPIP